MIYKVQTTNGAGVVAAQVRVFSIHHAANDEDLAPVPHRTTLSLVREEGDDLTARQLGIFLTMYLDGRQHTVRGLASLFGICKPAVTRSLDRLGELGLAHRKVDPRDRRSVLMHRTELGWAFLDSCGTRWAERRTTPIGRRLRGPRPASLGLKPFPPAKQGAGTVPPRTPRRTESSAA